MAPSSRAAFLCSAQRIDLESGCYRFHPTGHQAASFRPNGMLWTSLDRKSQCFHLSSSELLLQFCHCMLILGRVGEDSCCFLHRRWWILRPNAQDQQREEAFGCPSNFSAPPAASCCYTGCFCNTRLLRNSGAKSAPFGQQTVRSSGSR